MEKTLGKIKTLKNRRKLSLPAATCDERPSLDFEARSIRRLRSPSPATLNQKMPWNHRSSSPTLSENEEDEDIFTSHHTEVKVKAMRKSLRSRSICNPSSNNYSLMAGLKGVTSVVAVTGSHISGRRLSTPTPVPYERARRSDSASTVEEEARRLKAYMANRHGSLPVVIVNDGTQYSRFFNYQLFIEFPSYITRQSWKECAVFARIQDIFT